LVSLVQPDKLLYSLQQEQILPQQLLLDFLELLQIQLRQPDFLQLDSQPQQDFQVKLEPNLVQDFHRIQLQLRLQHQRAQDFRKLEQLRQGFNQGLAFLALLQQHQLESNQQQECQLIR
jgi:hypothetical protein